MGSPLQVSIPRNEITILVVAFILSAIYNVQTGLGTWGTISIITVIAILVLGTLFMMRITDIKTLSLFLLTVFLFTITGVMIGYNFIFHRSLRQELKEGYWSPILITSILHGIILIISLIAIILVSMNKLVMTNEYMKYYDNLFSIIVTLVLLNVGLMAGA
jgi:hypothetical protein